MSVQKPNLWRILSDSQRIISSNSLHFLALSSLFLFFPISISNIINSFTSPSTPVSNYGRLVSMQDSKLPPLDKSQMIPQLLYSLLFYLFDFCSVISITNSIFHGFHNKPLKLSSTLKSIIFSFFPLLATKIAYMVIVAAIFFGFGILMGFCFYGLALSGYSIDPNTTSFMAIVLVMITTALLLMVYLEVEWFLTETSVVVESKWGFAALGRSSSLVKGARGVALLIIVLFWVLDAMVWAWAGYLSRRSMGCVAVVEMGVRGAVFALLSLFSLASKTVFFVYCKAMNDELELPTRDKLGQVYVPLSLDAEDV